MYGAAEQLCVEIEALLKIIGRRATRQADHLERSSDSVLFNIAEGAGAFRPGLKINAYEIARKRPTRSVASCAAA